MSSLCTAGKRIIEKLLSLAAGLLKRRWWRGFVFLKAACGYFEAVKIDHKCVVFSDFLTERQISNVQLWEQVEAASRSLPGPTWASLPTRRIYNYTLICGGWSAKILPLKICCTIDWNLPWFVFTHVDASPKASASGPPDWTSGERDSPRAQ